MAVELLPDELWSQIEPLLPPPPVPSPRGGRPPVDNRAALREIIFINRTGIRWQMLPREVFGVSGSSCWRRLRDWTRLKVWSQVHRRLLNELGRRGGVDLARAVVDSQSVRAVKGGPRATTATWVPIRLIAENPGANVT
jgi:transposase